jgi:hypothetical protein
MADFDSSLPIRTENAGDVIAKIADATVPSQQLTVEADGSINVNAVFSPGTEVIITDGTDTLEINGDGSINSVVTATDLDIRDLTSASDSVEVLQNTHDDLNANANIQVNNTDVGNANPVPVSDAGGSITVDGSVTVSATDLDIRDLDAAQDNVAISDGTDTLAVNTDGSINITDNGGSLTVDATDLDIRDLTSASDSVEVLQASHDNLNANANIQVGNADVANGNPVPVSDAGGSLTVDATDLDIRDLSASTDSVAANIRDEAGNAFSNTNPLPVALVDVEGTEVNNYDTSSAIASGASDNHDYTASGAFKLRTVLAAASGKMKIEVQIETASGSNTFNTVFVAFNSTASPNIQIPIRDAISVVSGARVRVIRTNNDNQAQDVYSTISGFLV